MIFDVQNQGAKVVYKKIFGNIVFFIYFFLFSSVVLGFKY